MRPREPPAQRQEHHGADREPERIVEHNAQRSPTLDQSAPPEVRDHGAEDQQRREEVRGRCGGEEDPRKEWTEPTGRPDRGQEEVQAGGQVRDHEAVEVVPGVRVDIHDVREEDGVDEQRHDHAEQASRQQVDEDGSGQVEDDVHYEVRLGRGQDLVQRDAGDELRQPRRVVRRPNQWYVTSKFALSAV